MIGLKVRFSKCAIMAAILLLSVAVTSALAVEDQFSVDIDAKGDVVAGDGTGFSHGTWFYYPNKDWWNQWFYNGDYDESGRKVVELDLTFRVLNPTAAAPSVVTVALNWTTGSWPSDRDEPVPPLPQDIKSASQEDQLIVRRIVVPQRQVTQSIFINTSYEIPDYCPAWVSVDIRGQNVSVEGRIRHDCIDDEDPIIPTQDRDFGDAPEGALAYPASGVLGQFPTCVGVGPASWIEHDSQWLYFGPSVDVEIEGNGGFCPRFAPNAYDQDEGMTDNDAGLLKPRAYTIKGSAGSEGVYPLAFTGLESLGPACYNAIWGTNIDIDVHNLRSDGRQAYVNLLIDWNQDGKWAGASPCGSADVPEHVLVNFPIPNGYSGALSALAPASFRIGPYAGYVWARFSVTERAVPQDWNGDGVFRDGETEDYLLLVREAPTVCEWEEGDPHKMHWAQLPDLWPTGMDVDMYATSLADDFRCAETGPITGLHFWASFLDDVLPAKGVDSLAFEINIYSNQPANNLIPWSRPGQLLWNWQVEPFSYDVTQVANSIREGWFDPASKFYEPENHKRAFQYDICFDGEEEPFVQKIGTIYWIEIKEVPSNDTSYVFGWKTTEQQYQWNDSAVWLHTTLDWLPMVYPDDHQYESLPLDLAFVITGQSPVNQDFGDAPDRPYPTLHLSDGARHTVDNKVFLGRRVDAETDGQPSATATGDDDDGSDDEDGVAFVSALAAGSTATVEVTASAAGALNAWIDFNSDNDWNDAGEQIFVDEPLLAGVNTLTFDVPAHAAITNTYSRWRFSTTRGLDYTGPAPDGEVEDYLVTIEEEAIEPKPPVEHLKWSQPPLEWQPGSNVPVYCGWDELSFTHKTTPTRSSNWKIVADNFRCAGAMPVTSVHWWGSYQGWSSAEPPRIVPTSWRIGFWSNIASSVQGTVGRPGRLLWVVTADPSRVEIERVGVDEFPDAPSDTCFQYFLKLDRDEVFWQSQYIDSSTEDEVFWISITAVYVGADEPRYAWGWKTRPQPWLEGAVTLTARRDDLRAGINVNSSDVALVTNSLVCERLDKYDMAFELDTDPDYIKWEQPFTGLRHWAYYEDELSLATTTSAGTVKWTQSPDTTTSGMAVDITKDIPPTWDEQIAGDDFRCTTTGPITGISLWGAWYHDILPNNNANDVTFTLTIRADIPADRSPTGYSMPGNVLWRKEFKPGEFTFRPQEARTQSFYSPCNDTFEQNNHLMLHKYSFKIDAREAFQQTGTPGEPKVYWLCAQAYLIHSPGSVATRFGWHASNQHWNDDAVWVLAQEPYSGTSWGELRYPKSHSSAPRSVDLAFEIETEKGESALEYHQLVADDWQCNSPTPITGLVWWGSYIGYGYLPCECQQMTPPVAPDYFQVSIWSDAPDPTPGDPVTYSYPAEKIWEYRADEFDEVLVGFDRHPEASDTDMTGFEPVYRYTVKLPEEDWFCQENARDVYWLSVVAVYEDGETMTYPWGWTNHPHRAWDLSGRKMLAHWKLDESAGTVAGDSSGSGNDATVKGRPIWRPDAGYLGGAIDLDGSRDYLKVVKPTGFDLAPASFSVSAWVYPREVKGRYQAIMEYDRSSTDGNRFGLWIDSQGRFHFRVGRNTWQTTQTLAPNQWHLLVATFDEDTQQMNLYINGMLDGTATHNRGFVAPVQANLTLGVRGDEKGEFFNGLLDEVRVFSTTLSLEDVLTLIGGGRNDDAVAGMRRTDSSAWQWTELLDATGTSEDMSFMLLTEPVPCDDGKAADEDDGDDKKGTSVAGDSKGKS